jgi:hypothetical protein
MDERLGSRPVRGVRHRRSALTCYNQSAHRAHVAQAAERVLGKDKVTGSNPVVGSRVHCCPVRSIRTLDNTFMICVRREAGDGEGEV